MSKLSKAQAKAHAEACAMLTKDRLSEDERWFVLDNWQESANHINSTAGAFFTPTGLACDFAIETGGCRAFIDLCAGIGALAHMTQARCAWGKDVDRLVCVELNPAYAAVGRKIVPDAEWIEADVFALPDLGRFDMALSNPPFGATKRTGDGGHYHGRAFEYHVIDIASDLAEHGVFIIPQGSAPFRYSGHPYYEWRPGPEYEAFSRATGIELGASCGIDCEAYRKDWRGVAPAVEIVTADFGEARSRRAQTAMTAATGSDLPLFGVAA